jgi:hypothetical protein
MINVEDLIRFEGGRLQRPGAGVKQCPLPESTMPFPSLSLDLILNLFLILVNLLLPLGG